MATFKLLHGKQTTDDYPYGFNQRCSRTMEIEFKKNKGYRLTTQTTNPKTGRLNAPKNSTYHTFMHLYENEATGYTDYLIYSLNGTEDCQRFNEFLKEHRDQLNFTPQQSAELWSTIIASFKISAEWGKFKITPEGEKLMALQWLEACKLDQMIKLYGQKESILKLIDLDLNFIDITTQYEDRINGEAIKSYRMTAG